MKVAIITGANRGLGLELVKKFLNEDWRVIAACRDTSIFPKAEVLGKALSIWQLDVTDQASMDTFIDRCHKELSHIDVLINNAGVYDNATDGEPPFDQIIQIAPIFIVNSIAPRLLSDKLVGLLEKGQEKVVITVSSHFGAHSTLDEFMATHWPYSSSKAAVNYAMDAFTKLHPDIRSLLIHPGWMRTRLGGEEAPVDPKDSADSIYKLYEKADQLENGRLFQTDGSIIEW